MKSNMQIGTLGIIIGLIGAIGVPFIYVGGIKEINAVQANQISTLESNYNELRTEIKDMRADTNKRLDALLQDRGIRVK